MYVIIRWAFAIYSLVFLALSIWDYSKYVWLFALTSVNYILCTIYFIYAALNVTRSYKRPSCQTEQATKGMQRCGEGKASTKPVFLLRNKVHWFLYNLSLVTCTFVFFAFWLMLAPNRKGGYGPTLHSFLVIDRHGINWLLMIIDFVLNKIPVRLLHFVYTSLFLGLYMVYNSIYWATTGHLVYGKILDYGSNPGMVSGMAFGGMLVIIPLIQFAWFSMSIFKQRFSTDLPDANANVEFQQVC